MADPTKPVSPVIRTDAYVRHEMYVQRFAITSSNKFRLDNMHRIEREYAAILSQYGNVTNKAQANALAKALSEKTSEVLEDEIKSIGVDMESFAQVESGWNKSTLSTVMGSTAAIAAPEVILKQAKNHVMTGGQTVDEFIRSVVPSNRAIAKKAVFEGWKEGLTNAQIAKKLIGNPKFNFKDGNMQQLRRGVDAMIRTQINAISDNARAMTFAANADIVKSEMILATLDARTSLICQYYDHKVFKRGVGPRPPFHPNCRSVTIPLFKGETAEDIVGKRPAVNAGPGYEHGSNVTRTGKVRKPRLGDDTFRVTQTNASQTMYGDFLLRQKVAFQDDVLGKRKAELFRANKLRPDDLVKTTKNGYFQRPLTLAELEKKYATFTEGAGKTAPIEYEKSLRSVLKSKSVAGKPKVASDGVDAVMKDLKAWRIKKVKNGKLLYGASQNHVNNYVIPDYGTVRLNMTGAKVFAYEYNSKIGNRIWEKNITTFESKLAKELAKKPKKAPPRITDTKIASTGAKLNDHRGKVPYVNNANNINMIDQYKNITDTVPVEFINAYDNRLAQVVGAKSNKVAVRVDNGILAKILKDKRFKTQFETGDTEVGGLFDPALRGLAEKDLFGTSIHIAKSKRPVYGYIDDGAFKSPYLDSYGKVKVQLKDSIKNRTTITVGDSLDDSGVLISEDVFLVPSRMAAPNINSVKASIVKDAWDTSYIHLGFEKRLEKSIQKIKKMSLKDFNEDYIEAQIHGGITTADIDIVTFAKMPPKPLQNLLTENKIKWQVGKKKAGVDFEYGSITTLPKIPSAKTALWTKQDLLKFEKFRSDTLATAKSLKKDIVKTTVIKGRPIEVAVHNGRLSLRLAGEPIPAKKIRGSLKDYKPGTAAPPTASAKAGKVSAGKTTGAGKVTPKPITPAKTSISPKALIVGENQYEGFYGLSLQAAKTPAAVDVSRGLSVVDEMASAPVANKFSRFIKRKQPRVLFVDKTMNKGHTLTQIELDAIKDNLGLQLYKNNLKEVKVNPKGYTSINRKHVVVRTDGAVDFKTVNIDLMRTAIDDAVDNAELYVTRSHSISDQARKFSSGALQGDSQSTYVTMLHEIGHQIHYWAGKPDVPTKFRTLHSGSDMGRFKSLTDYGSVIDAEWHAEHFAAWLMNRKALAKFDPAIAKYFDDLVDTATKSTKKFDKNGSVWATDVGADKAFDALSKIGVSKKLPPKLKAAQTEFDSAKDLSTFNAWNKQVIDKPVKSGFVETTRFKIGEDSLVAVKSKASGDITYSLNGRVKSLPDIEKYFAGNKRLVTREYPPTIPDLPANKYISKSWDDAIKVSYKEFTQDLPESAITAYENKFRELVLAKNTDLAIRVPSARIDDILRDGRFKTQFETKKTGGFLDADLRMMAEKQLFATPDDIAKSKRPVYGYVDDNSYYDIAQYGDVKMILNEKAKSRATITAADSLDSSGAAREGVKILGPSPLLNPNINSVMNDMIYNRFSKNNPTGDLAKGLKNINEIKKLDDMSISYIEAQIHDGVSVSDISKIIFKKPPQAATVKRLDNLGIKWEVTNPAVMPKAPVAELEVATFKAPSIVSDKTPRAKALYGSDRYDIKVVDKTDTRVSFEYTPKGIDDWSTVRPVLVDPDTKKQFIRDAIYYNPKVATPVKSIDDFGTRYQFRLKEGFVKEVAQDDDLMYRGISFEEFQNIKSTGQIKSFGAYNLGDEQIGLTYYSTKASQASHYAHGFAPVQYQAVPSKPAYVIAVKKRPGKAVAGTGENEVGIGPINAGEIVEVWKGTPYTAGKGTTDIIKDFSGIMDGSASPANIAVAWSKESKLPKFAKKAPVEYEAAMPTIWTKQAQAKYENVLAKVRDKAKAGTGDARTTAHINGRKITIVIKNNIVKERYIDDVIMPNIAAFKSALNKKPKPTIAKKVTAKPAVPKKTASLKAFEKWNDEHIKATVAHTAKKHVGGYDVVAEYKLSGNVKYTIGFHEYTLTNIKKLMSGVPPTSVPYKVGGKTVKAATPKISHVGATTKPPAGTFKGEVTGLNSEIAKTKLEAIAAKKEIVDHPFSTSVGEVSISTNGTKLNLTLKKTGITYYEAITKKDLIKLLKDNVATPPPISLKEAKAAIAKLSKWNDKNVVSGIKKGLGFKTEKIKIGGYEILAHYSKSKPPQFFIGKKKYTLPNLKKLVSGNINASYTTYGKELPKAIPAVKAPTKLEMTKLNLWLEKGKESSLMDKYGDWMDVYTMSDGMKFKVNFTNGKVTNIFTYGTKTPKKKITLSSLKDLAKQYDDMAPASAPAPSSASMAYKSEINKLNDFINKHKILSKDVKTYLGHTSYYATHKLPNGGFVKIGFAKGKPIDAWWIMKKGTGAELEGKTLTSIKKILVKYDNINKPPTPTAPISAPMPVELPKFNSLFNDGKEISKKSITKSYKAIIETPIGKAEIYFEDGMVMYSTLAKTGMAPKEVSVIELRNLLKKYDATHSPKVTIPVGMKVKEVNLPGALDKFEEWVKYQKSAKAYDYATYSSYKSPIGTFIMHFKGTNKPIAEFRKALKLYDKKHPNIATVPDLGDAFDTVSNMITSSTPIKRKGFTSQKFNVAGNAITIGYDSGKPVSYWINLTSYNKDEFIFALGGNKKSILPDPPIQRNILPPLKTKNIPPKASPVDKYVMEDAKRQIEKEQREVFDYVDAPENFIEQVEQQLRYVINKPETSLDIRVPANVVDDIFTDGRYKTMFETKTGIGAADWHDLKYAFDERRNVESELFGYSKKARLKTRPAYGYLDDSKGKDVTLGGYGNVILHLKKKNMKDRITITGGDSFNWDDNSFIGTTFNDPKITSLPNHVIDNIVNKVSSISSLNRIKDFSERFMEFQVHGGPVTVSDIEAITFVGRKPTPAIIALLKRHKIKWDSKAGKYGYGPHFDI